WKTVFLMACLIPLGWAMDASGAAAWLAGHTIERLPEGMPIWLIQLAVSLLTAAFSMVITHVGATIVVVPLAINFALAAAGKPPAFALVVALSPSKSVVTQSGTAMAMITAAGGYGAAELLRIGFPLSLLSSLIVGLAVNLMF